MINLMKKNNTNPEQTVTLRPPVDIYEKDNQIIVEVETPGVDKDTLNVQVQNNTLTISANRKKDRIEEKFTPLYQERYTVVEYRREFELSSEVDHENIKANLNGGVLKIILTKSTEAQPKKIEISSSA